MKDGSLEKTSTLESIIPLLLWAYQQEASALAAVSPTQLISLQSGFPLGPRAPFWHLVSFRPFCPNFTCAEVQDVPSRVRERSPTVAGCKASGVLPVRPGGSFVLMTLAE